MQIEAQHHDFKNPKKCHHIHCRIFYKISQCFVGNLHIQRRRKLLKTAARAVSGKRAARSAITVTWPYPPHPLLLQSGLTTVETITTAHVSITRVSFIPAEEFYFQAKFKALYFLNRFEIDKWWLRPSLIPRGLQHIKFEQNPRHRGKKVIELAWYDPVSSWKMFAKIF